MVAAELERRWQAALRDLHAAEEKLQLKALRSDCWAIPADLLEMLKQVGPALPELWEQGVFSWQQKKALLRSLVDKVVLKRDNDRVTMRVVWRGGDATEQVVRVTVGRFEQLSHAKEIEQTIVAMANQRRTDREIADHLTAAGHRLPRSDRFLPSTVASVRMQHGILHKEGPCRPHVIPGHLRAHQLVYRVTIA